MKPLHKLQQALDVFRSHDEIMPSQRIEAFLLVALRGHATQKELAKDLGLHVNSVARHMASMETGSYVQNTRVYDGLGWIEAYPDPIEPRRLAYKLTTKGRRVADQVANIIGGR